MLIRILSLLLEVAASLLGGACLLRLYMQCLRVPFNNPIGRFVFALSDWLVLPLRKVVPAWGRWDLSSLLGAWLIKLAQVGLLGLLGGGLLGASPLWLLWATLGLLQLMVSALTWLLIAYAVLSWVQPHAWAVGLLDRLCEPVLRPFRRVIPLVGGVDLAPLAALVLLQIVAMLLVAY